jgi:hypothetical protein
MNNNFPNLFRQYSNVELLKIIQRPADYQTEAINAANEILAGRNVSEVEYREVELFYEVIDLKEQQRLEKFNAINNKFTDFLEPLLQPKTEIKRSKWLNVFLLFVALQFLWSIFKTIKRFINFFGCSYCLFDITYAADVLTLFYVPVVFYLLYKRKKWGWILLFADALISGLSAILGSFALYTYSQIMPVPRGEVSAIVWTIFANVALIIFLWREDIAAHFGLTEEEKKKLAIRILLVVAALFGGILVAFELMK